MNISYADFSYAGVYKWIDENGKSHYTDSPSKIPRKYRENNSVNTLVSGDEEGNVNGQQRKPVSQAQKIQYKKAEKALSQFVQADPGNPRGYIRRGHVRNLMGNTKSGARDINQGLRMVNRRLSKHPNDCTAYQMMAEAYRYMRQYDKSIIAIQKAIKISPQVKNYRRDLQAIRNEMSKANL